MAGRYVGIVSYQNGKYRFFDYAQGRLFDSLRSFSMTRVGWHKERAPGPTCGLGKLPRTPFLEELRE
jgi:hypothetical protein